eukprot:CAMPEP_0172623338 /NCGR_PEP_ID=MMETSP1068-20121228/127726_1 /TAXON_ID=35684 /ORGANISM="Pseudopedinella elastica, Strain CCMP716" /LENGTH=31 /DNA_ID= /DNA_START= /DNA_END= /DNA_ORIENTATION=
MGVGPRGSRRAQAGRGSAAAPSAAPSAGPAP